MSLCKIRPGVELDLTAGLMLIDMAEVLRHLRLPDGVPAHYDLAYAVLAGLDDFAEENNRALCGIPTTSDH